MNCYTDLNEFHRRFILYFYSSIAQKKYIPFWTLKIGLLFTIFHFSSPETIFNGTSAFFDYGLNSFCIGLWLVGCYFVVPKATYLQSFVAVTQELKHLSLVFVK
jgi:hypothetical protein